MKKAKTKLYVTTNDGQLGYVDYICKCDRCKERGMWEVFINTTEVRNTHNMVIIPDGYLDCIKLNKLSQEIKFCSTDKSLVIRYMKKFLLDKIVDSIVNNMIESMRDKTNSIRNKFEEFIVEHFDLPILDLSATNPDNVYEVIFEDKKEREVK